MFPRLSRLQSKGLAVLLLLMLACSQTHATWIPNSTLYLATGDAGQIVIDTSSNQIDFVANLGAQDHKTGLNKFRGDIPFSIAPRGFSGQVTNMRREFWLKFSPIMSANGRFFSPRTADQTIRVFDRINPEQSIHLGIGLALGFLGDGDVLAYFEHTLQRDTGRVGNIQRFVVRNVITKELLYSRRFTYNFGRKDNYGEWGEALDKARGSFNLQNSRFIVFGEKYSTESVWIYDHKARAVLRPTLTNKEHRGQFFSFSPDGSQLAIFGSRARILDTNTWKPISNLEPSNKYDKDSEPVGSSALAFTSDSQYLIANRQEGVAIYETATGKLIDKRAQNNSSWAVSASGTFVAAFFGRKVVPGSAHVKLWEIRNGEIGNVEMCGSVCNDLRLKDPSDVAISSDGKRLMVYNKAGMHLVDIANAKITRMSFSASQVSRWLGNNDNLPFNTQCLLFEPACKQVSPYGTPYWAYEVGSKVSAANENRWKVSTEYRQITAEQCDALRDPNICVAHFKHLVGNKQYDAVAKLCRESTILCHDAAIALDVNNLVSKTKPTKQTTPLDPSRQAALDETMQLACTETASLLACQNVQGYEHATLHLIASFGIKARGTPHYIVEKLVNHLHRSDTAQGWPLKQLHHYPGRNTASNSVPNGLSELKTLKVPVNEENTPVNYRLRIALIVVALLVLGLLVMFIAFKLPVLMLPVGVALMLSPIWLWLNVPDRVFATEGPGGILVFFFLVAVSGIAFFCGLALMSTSLASIISKVNKE